MPCCTTALQIIVKNFGKTAVHNATTVTIHVTPTLSLVSLTPNVPAHVYPGTIEVGTTAWPDYI